MGIFGLNDAGKTGLVVGKENARAIVSSELGTSSTAGGSSSST